MVTKEADYKNIITQRLCLRRLQDIDEETFYIHRSNPRVNKYQSWRPLSKKEINMFIKEQEQLLFDTPDTWYQLAICDKVSGIMLGDCGLHFLNENSLQNEIGFTIYPPYQGFGYAIETVKAILGYLFVERGKHRVFANVDPRNTPSVRVMERVGLRKEAHLHKSLWSDNEWVDEVIYALLEEEWLEKSQ